VALRVAGLSVSPSTLPESNVLHALPTVRLEPSFSGYSILMAEW
jgi:hypothetical protein